MPSRLHLYLKRRLPAFLLMIQEYAAAFWAANRVMEQTCLDLPPQRFLQQSLCLLIPRQVQPAIVAAGSRCLQICQSMPGAITRQEIAATRAGKKSRLNYFIWRFGARRLRRREASLFPLVPPPPCRLRPGAARGRRRLPASR